MDKEARKEELQEAFAESRANDRQGMAYLAQVRKVVGGADFPDMVSRVKAQSDALAKAREVIELALYVADLCGGTWESMAKEALNAIEQLDGAQRWNLAWAGEEGKESK